jgi:hypothetical protein
MKFINYILGMSLSSTSHSRREKLLKNSGQRMSKITGSEAAEPQEHSSSNLLSTANRPKNNVEGYETAESSGNELTPSIPQADPKRVTPDQFRHIITVVHSIMLVVSGIFTLFAYVRNCRQCSCFSVLDRTMIKGCEEDIFLAKLFFFSGLLSVEVPFVFLTIKTTRYLGPQIFARMLSGVSLYMLSYVLAGCFYQYILQ